MHLGASGAVLQFAQRIVEKGRFVGDSNPRLLTVKWDIASRRPGSGPPSWTSEGGVAELAGRAAPISTEKSFEIIGPLPGLSAAAFVRSLMQ
jgi:hypothetical protein